MEGRELAKARQKIVETEFKHSFPENGCGMLDCAEYYLYGSYWTVMDARGVASLYIRMKFSRPEL